MELYIVRHGQSKGNIHDDKLIISDEQKKDPSLTPLGKNQARLLGERFSGEKLTTVISSPLIRAVETAAAVIEHQPVGGAKTLEIMPELMEVDTDPGFCGCGFDKLKQKFPFVLRCPDAGLNDFIGKESRSEQLARAYFVINAVKRRFTADEKVMLSAHGTFNHYLIAAALGLGVTLPFNFCQENTGVTKVNYFDNTGRIRLSYMDDLSHLFEDYPTLQFEL